MIFQYIDQLLVHRLARAIRLGGGRIEAGRATRFAQRIAEVRFNKRVSKERRSWRHATPAR